VITRSADIICCLINSPTTTLTLSLSLAQLSACAPRKLFLQIDLPACPLFVRAKRTFRVKALFREKKWMEDIIKEEMRWRLKEKGFCRDSKSIQMLFSTLNIQ